MTRNIAPESTGKEPNASAELLRAELANQARALGFDCIGVTDPGAIIDILLELLPLRQAYSSRNIAPPPALLNAIERMTQSEQVHLAQSVELRAQHALRLRVLLVTAEHIEPATVRVL